MMTSSKAIPGDKSSGKEGKQSRDDKFRGIYSKIVDAMMGQHGRMPKFPVTFHRQVDHLGNSIVYQEMPNKTVRYTVNEVIEHEATKYWDKCKYDPGQYWGEIEPKDFGKIRQIWMRKSTPRTTKYPPLVFKSDKQLALHRLSWDQADSLYYDYSQLKSLDCYSELMSRIDDHRILMAWIGSLLDPHSQRQQYAWIYGAGGDGKGAMIRCLLRELGVAAAIENFPDSDSKRFWTFFFKDRRLLIFPDVDNAKMVTTGLWKSITGEDSVRMEIKNGSVFTEELQIKCLLSSNSKPDIKGTAADLRRALIFRISGDYKDFGADYEQRLQAETKEFLMICYNVYLDETAGNPRKQFKLTKDVDNLDAIDRIASENELDNEIFANEYICVREGTYISGSRMLELMKRAGFNSRHEQGQLRRYLERKHGIKYTHVYTSEDRKNRTKGYLGCYDPLEYEKNEKNEDLLKAMIAFNTPKS